jgi:hypothetical protein
LIVGTLATLSLFSFFREAVTAFMVRWNDASASEDSTARILGWFFDAFALSPEAGLFGKGIGMGTNAASALLTGTSQFLLAETEWSRVILESGPLLGFSFLAYRIWVAGDIAVRAAAAAKQQHLLAWLLAWDACRYLINEQMSPPTQLGFMVFVGGLCLAAMPARHASHAAEHTRREQPSRNNVQFESQLAMTRIP